MYTDGLQWPLTNVPSTGVVLVLVDTTAQEFMPATLQRIVGYVDIANSGSDAATAGSDAAFKIMYVEVNDAQTMSGDHAGIDTHEEDIAQRQLWTFNGRFHTMGANADAGDIDRLRIPIDMRGKLKLEPHGKKLLVLIGDATASNRIQVTGYLRCFLKHG